MATTADYDVLPDGSAVPIKSRTRGGARPGAGRPRKDQVPVDPDLFGDEKEPEEGPDARFTRAKAKKEEALANIHALNYEIQRGEYLPRGAYRQATAEVLSTLSQSLRSLPDTLERRCTLAPEVLQAIEAAINEVLSEAADTLALFTGDSA